MIPVERVGLFGGSFDPVHCGHLLMAQTACEEFNLDHMIFIPAAQAPMKAKDTETPAAERVRLLRLALAGYPQYIVDELEIQRGGVSYTIDTVREFRKRHPQATICYLIGADHVPLLPKWRDAEELAREVEFLIIPRPGKTPGDLAPGFRGHHLHGIPFGVSSTGIRDRVSKGLSIRHLVPTAVAEAIAELNLYRNND